MRDGGDGACDAGLVLRLGRAGETGMSARRDRGVQPSSTKLEPSAPPNTFLPPGPPLTLGLSETNYRKPVEEKTATARRQTVKKESETGSEETEMFSTRGSDGEEEGGARKKLRLTKEQSALLEDRFKEKSTLNPKQKLALAKQLSLRPRQVEVWFQNRRARTKLKQTEVDCEFLRRCCEALAEENRRLQKELQELKETKLSTREYMRLPSAAFAVCPSCERTTTGAVSDDSKMVSFSATTAAVGRKKALYLNTHFKNPAAC